jgi:hypothetical protein
MGKDHRRMRFWYQIEPARGNALDAVSHAGNVQPPRFSAKKAEFPDPASLWPDSAINRQARRALAAFASPSRFGRMRRRRDC